MALANMKQNGRIAINIWAVYSKRKKWLRCKDGEINLDTTISVCNSCIGGLHDKFGADGTVQNVDKEHPEDLAVQLRMEVLRQYYYVSSLYLQEICLRMLP
jgi:hypothetical protein